MKKEIKSLAVAVLGLAAVACASPEKMAEMAESVTVTCDPSPLEVVAGKIDATVSVTYPRDYFHPKAILEVTPVLVYDGGEAKMTPFMFQGEKVKDNYTVVSKDGQTVTEKVHFDYVKGMEQSHLELRGVVKYKKKSIDLPVKKVADGANTTYMLVGVGEGLGSVAYKADNYQEVIPQTAEGQILYTINSADVRSKELKSASIKDFQAALDEIKSNERKTLKGTEVVAYASPDGGEELNAKLSDKRSKSADKAWSKVVEGKEVSDPEVKSVGQDWEGFQELVSESNIEDKDLSSAFFLCTAILLFVRARLRTCLRFTPHLRKKFSLNSVVQDSSLTLSIRTIQKRNSLSSLKRTWTFSTKRLSSVLLSS